MKKIIVSLLLVNSSNAFAVRDPFEIKAIDTYQMQANSIPLEQFVFLGSITTKQTILGVISDPHRHYIVHVGQSIGQPPMRILKIMRDKIILADNHHFLVLQ